MFVTLFRTQAGLGAISAVIAVLCFSINDVSIKFLSGDYALHQITLIRSLIGISVLLLVIVPLEGGFQILRTQRLPLHVIRGLCVVFANMTFFTGLSVLPLANAVAVFYISPLIITALSVVFLGERVGIFRWGAVLVGMMGVVIMLRPGLDGIQVALLLPLAAACGYAILHIMTRSIGMRESASTMAFYIQLTFIVLSGVIGLLLGDGAYSGQGGEMFEFVLRGWVWPAYADYPIFFLIGVTSAAGGYCISQAYRLAEASLIAPLEYVAMPIAIMFGLLVFGEWPDWVAWIGIVLIIGAGLVVWWRESYASGASPLAQPKTRR